MGAARRWPTTMPEPGGPAAAPLLCAQRRLRAFSLFLTYFEIFRDCMPISGGRGASELFVWCFSITNVMLDTKNRTSRRFPCTPKNCLPGPGGPRNGFVKEHRVRATGTGSRLAANTHCGHDVRYIGFQSRHQTMPGLASSSLEGPAMCCISGHTAAVKLHNQGKS